MGKQNIPTTKQAQEAEALKAIFREDSGKIPDLSRLDRHRSNVIVWMFAGISGFLAFILAAVWLGFVFFKPLGGFEGAGLTLTVDGPERVTLGKETMYFLNYQNSSSEPIAAAEVRVSFPPDFSVTATDRPSTGDGLVWRLGALPVGGRGTITIKGIFAGALETKTAIQVVGTYRPSSVSSEFETLAIRQLEYAESVLESVLIIPEKILPGDVVRIAYTITNHGSEVLQNLGARVTLPSGFVREASSTEALLDGRIVSVDIGAVPPGASTTIIIAGTFTSGASGDLPIHAEVGRIAPDGAFQAAHKTEAIASVLAGDLLVHLVVNGSDEHRSVGAHEPLHIAIAYSNTSPEEIKGVTLQFVLEPVATTTSGGAFVDWSLEEGTASGTRKGNVVTWNKDQMGDLARLSPQADGIIEFSVPVAVYASGTLDVPFQMFVQATMVSVGKTVIHRVVKTTPIEFRLRTDASVGVEARYFSEEGAQLGDGPLPPVAGKTTTYRIGWLLQKTVHELTDIRISAVLPKSVTWPGNATVSAGDISYDDATRSVTWTLNRMPANVAELTADFDVQLTPTQMDIGRFADLFGETRFDAKDAALNETIVRVKPALSTDLSNDEGAKSKGVVRRP